MTIIFIRNVVRQGDNGQTKPIFVLDFLCVFCGYILYPYYTLHYIAYCTVLVRACFFLCQKVYVFLEFINISFKKKNEADKWKKVF